jgi:amino acid permease
MLILACLATAFSIDLLIKCRNATGLKSYEEMTVALFGTRIGLIVELNIIIFCFGTAVAYCKALQGILNPVMLLANAPDWLTGPDGEKVSITLAWALLMFPLSLIKKMNSLRVSSSPHPPSSHQTSPLRPCLIHSTCEIPHIRHMCSLCVCQFSSFFGVAAIFYLVFAGLLHSGLHEGFTPERWSQGGGTAYPSLFAPMSFLDIVQAMPIMMFAFTCQVNVFAIYSELEHASPKRMSEVTNGALMTCFVVYLFMGVAGFSDFPKNTSANILDNYCLHTHHDPYIVAAFGAITITVLMAFPLNIFPCRYQCRQSASFIQCLSPCEPSLSPCEPSHYFVVPAEPPNSSHQFCTQSLTTSPLLRYTVEMMLASREIVDIESMSPAGSSALNFVLTVLISGGALLVSLYVPNIGLVFGLMGGTASAFVCFVLPAAFALKVGVAKDEPVKQALVWALAIGGGSIGALSTAVTIYQTTLPAVVTSFCEAPTAYPTSRPTHGALTNATDFLNAVGNSVLGP